MDELEEELKALMLDTDTKSDGISDTLPKVPSSPLGPAREPGQGRGTLLSSLPNVPNYTFDITKDLGLLLVPFLEFALHEAVLYSSVVMCMSSISRSL